MAANGFLPASGLTTVQGSIELPQRAAQAWFALEAAARSEFGVDLNITSPGGGYRSYAMQLDMYRNPTYYGAKPGKVAAPGNSVHGTLPGCVDIYNWAVLGTARLDTIARRFGWRRTIASEPWHYQYDGSTASTAGSGSSGATTTPTLKKGKQHMTQVLITTFPPMADSDPRIAKIKSYQGGDKVTNFLPGVGVIALVGDSPGTPANVQVTQADKRGNEWAADHSGSWGAIEQAARPYDLDEFLALCDSYLAPLNVPATGGGSVSVDVSPVVEALALVEAAVNRLNPPG